ncbi:vacuolar protein sorting-associated protein 72 homolog isoform X3 [Varroa jacobsoni]|uniref:Vacuolar protein sorting-associated protein 72 homolog n=1 Tax=Varroa destructor TaxID=109461 RepID=A0A7M7KC94_VARDE|nr:vacuolar protein sorting-associated protein 72 homolog isoform X3 [Varroa destructor]XP_022688930.1 vacuolar protein sorting-associated protein 72 homolog isoform X3 [Varroa jacobsoni]
MSSSDGAGSGSSSSCSDDESFVGLAVARSRRGNAGAKMAKLLNAEEEDEFYKTSYGGFNEEENDQDFGSDDASGSEDEVDSDFDIDENDDVLSEHEDEDGRPGRKRKTATITKSYKDPKARKSTPRTPRPKRPCLERDSGGDTFDVSGASLERKSKRKSTQAKSEAVEARRRAEAAEARRRRHYKVRREDEPEMTQEELLEEAKQTEIENLKSLERYQQLEQEKKSVRTKQPMKGPMIRFHSLSMPLLEEVDAPAGDPVPSIDGKGELRVATVGRCMRNLVTFPDEATLKKLFPQTKPKPATKNFCPISRQPARYFDPVTHIAYANLQGYRVLREAYYNQLESKGDMRQPEVAAWIEWRRRTKAASQQQAAALRQKQAAAAQAAALAAAQQQNALQAAQQLGVPKGTVASFATVKTVAQTTAAAGHIKPSAASLKTSAGTVKPAAAALAAAGTLKPGTLSGFMTRPTGSGSAVRPTAIAVKPSALAGTTGPKPLAAAGSSLRPAITTIRPVVATVKPTAAAGPGVVQQIQQVRNLVQQQLQKPIATVQPVQQHHIVQQQIQHHQVHQIQHQQHTVHQVQQQQLQQQQLQHQRLQAAVQPPATQHQ